MNWLKVLVGLSAILVAGCAAYFSVTGLGVLFAGASISVMVMAGSLELAKLVAATYLKQEWDTLKGFNKWYLTISVGTLMLITSAGIFGYLSNAFQQQNLGLQKIERDIAVYQTQITKNDAEIARYTTQYIKAIPPVLCRNMDIFVIFKFANIKSVTEQIYPEVSGVIKEEDFETIFEYATKERHNSLIIDQTAKKYIFKLNWDVGLHLTNNNLESQNI